MDSPRETLWRHPTSWAVLSTHFKRQSGFLLCLPYDTFPRRNHTFYIFYTSTSRSNQASRLNSLDTFFIFYLNALTPLSYAPQEGGTYTDTDFIHNNIAFASFHFNGYRICCTYSTDNATSQPVVLLSEKPRYYIVLLFLSFFQ